MDDVFSVTEQWDGRNSNLQSQGWAGGAGRRLCSEAVTVLLTQSRQAAERHMLRNQCRWLSSPQGHRPGCQSGYILSPHTWLCPCHWSGQAGLGLEVRKGTMLGGTWTVQCGSEDNSIPSMGWLASPLVG